MDNDKTLKLCNPNDTSGIRIVNGKGNKTLEDYSQEAQEVFGSVTPVEFPEIEYKENIINRGVNLSFSEWSKELNEKYESVLFLSDSSCQVGEERKPLTEIQTEYDRLYELRNAERVSKGLSRLNGLVVLHANYIVNQFNQHGWSDLYYPIKKLNISKRYKVINAIRECHSRENRLWLFNHNVIDEIDIYAWFYDLVWRQNNQGIVVKDENGNNKVIENLSGRWNKKRPFGYQVRKRLRGVLENVKKPLHVVLSIDSEKIKHLIPDNTNLDVVMYSILNIGKWITDFNRNLYYQQKRNGLTWQFKGWVLEFQGEKEDTETRQYVNRGFPHPHIIYAGNWLGDIKKIQKLWPYGRCDLTTVKDVIKGKPWIKETDGLRLANYLTKYVSKQNRAVTETGVHRGFAMLAFFGGRVFAIKHNKGKGEENETTREN